MNPDNPKKEISWNTTFSLLTNKFFVQDLFGITFLTVAVFQMVLIFAGFMSGEEVSDLIFSIKNFGIIYLTLFLLLAFSAMLLGNKFNIDFKVDESGIFYQSGKREKKINKIVLVLMLLLRPSRSGSGFLAVSGESGMLSWKDVYSAKFYDNDRVISVYNSWRMWNRIYCTPENYAEVSEFIKARLGMGEEFRKRNPKTKKPIYFYLAWIISAIIASFLLSAWSWIEYGKSMPQLIILSGILTAVSGLTITKFASKLISFAALISIGIFLFQLAGLALKTSESYGGIRYGYQYDTNLLFITLAGVLLSAGLNIYAFKGKKETRS